MEAIRRKSNVLGYASLVFAAILVFGLVLDFQGLSGSYGWLGVIGTVMGVLGLLACLLAWVAG